MPKIYFYDTGLLVYLLGSPFNLTRQSQFIIHLRTIQRYE